MVDTRSDARATRKLRVGVVGGVIVPFIQTATPSAFKTQQVAAEIAGPEPFPSHD
jgi:fucose permease